MDQFGVNFAEGAGECAGVSSGAVLTATRASCLIMPAIMRMALHRQNRAIDIFHYRDFRHS